MSYFSKRLQLLTHAPIRWYLINCFLATVGGGLSYVTLSWLILQVDNSVAAVALLMLCFWVPNVVLGPWLGVIADRYSRKWLIVGAHVVRAGVLLGFGWWFQHDLTSTSINFLMVLLGLCFSIYFPASMALIREIVIPADLLYANATIDMAYELGNIIGMGSAGILIAFFSAPVTILLNGILFVFCAVAMMRVRSSQSMRSVPFTKARDLLKDLIQGFYYLRNNTQLLIIYGIQLIILVGFMTTPILLVPFAKNLLHTTVTQFGHIEAALSIGVVLGGLFIPWLADQWGLMRSVALMCLSLALFFSFFGVNRSILIAEWLYFFIGMGLSIWPLIVTEAQRATDINFQARVQSVFNSLTGVLIVLVYLLVDWCSRFISVSALYLIEVALILSATLLLWYYRRTLKNVVIKITSPSHDQSHS
ncbi:MAG: MFS transporter [Gammaproteobacteria bacterium RIFCSPHIGHO2_12_FULL_41_15]|nr:MAG: MFS transporter [Gammaproteobacteria bacterium RIFCSPHIGHO2_12_FULL_41_15]